MTEETKEAKKEKKQEERQEPKEYIELSDLREGLALNLGSSNYDVEHLLNLALMFRESWRKDKPK